jgi:hypothetical protein
MKLHCPQDWETLLDEKEEGFTPSSPPQEMASRAPLVYIIPNIDYVWE